MAALPSNDRANPEAAALLHAFVAERVHANRCRQSLAQLTSKAARHRCNLDFDASVERATALAFALIDMGQPVPTTDTCAEFDGRLLDAMDSVLWCAHRDARVGRRP